MGTVEGARNAVFPALACFMTLGKIFPIIFSPLSAFVPTAESSLGQGQFFIPSKTLSKASHDIAGEQITQQDSWVTEVHCKSVSTCVTPTPTAAVWRASGTYLVCPWWPVDKCKAKLSTLTFGLSTWPKWEWGTCSAFFILQRSCWVSP